MVCLEVRAGDGSTKTKKPKKPKTILKALCVCNIVRQYFLIRDTTICSKTSIWSLLFQHCIVTSLVVHTLPWPNWKLQRLWWQIQNVSNDPITIAGVKDEHQMIDVLCQFRECGFCDVFFALASSSSCPISDACANLWWVKLWSKLFWWWSHVFLAKTVPRRTHTHRHRGSLSRGKTFLSCSRGTACLLGKEKRHRSRSRRRRPDSLHSLTLCVCCSRVFLDIFSKVRFSSVSAWNQTSSICGPWCHSASLPTHSTVTMSLKAQKGGGAQHLLTCCTSNPEHRLLWTDRTWQDSM